MIKLATRDGGAATYVRSGSDMLLYAVPQMIRRTRYFHGQALRNASDAASWGDTWRATEALAIAAYYRKSCGYWLAARRAGEHFYPGHVDIAWPQF